MYTPDVWYGGAKEVTLSANYVIVDRATRVFTFNPSVSGWTVTLPDARRFLQTGADAYVLINLHASRTITLKDNAGNTLLTINGREGVTVALFSNATQAGTWKLQVSTGV